MLGSSLAVSLASALALGAGSPAQEPRQISTPPTFVVTGRGWGHGVGMSQYGALGFAQRGFTYDRILAHYYRGTALAPAPVRKVRVLLANGVRSLTVSSEKPFRVRDASGEVHPLAAGGHSFGPELRLRPEGAEEAQPLVGPVLFLPGAAPLELKRPYRGSIEVASVEGKLRAVNVVGLEPYLYGVVPAEMPHTWPAEALKAQAVVARSYALANRRGDAFDLYSDVRSQVYRGIEEEEPAAGAAVDATAGQVLTYDGRVVSTPYHSTSGGRTAAAADVWGEHVPYLVSVPDPYDSLSPHHNWGPFVFSADQLARKLRVPGKLLDLTTSYNASGRVSSVLALGSRGEVSVLGSDFRRTFGLRSTWFRVGVLSLARPIGPVVYGSKVKLTGTVRSVTGVSLEQRAGSTSWEPAGRIAPAEDGTFAVVVKPRITTHYRLTSESISGESLRVPVAPLVRFTLTNDTTALRGLARPVLPGAPVEIQRLDGTVWTAVARTVVDADGNFEAKLRLTPGTYRARLVPGRGFVPGVSPILRVLPA